MGKGAAIIAGRSSTCAATSRLIQDADLEYDPADYPALVAPILEGKADAVFGSRFASASQRKVLLYWHGVANHFLTWLTNILNDINLTDMETCYKAVRADILKQTPLYSNRFGIEPELTTKLAQWNIRLYEVPISYHGRTVAEGKKIGWKDAVSAVWTLLKIPLHRRPVHDARRLLRAPEHAPRARPEPVDPRAVPAVRRQPRARSRVRHRQLHRAAARSGAACCASTTIRSTSRWRTGASATSRTSARIAVRPRGSCHGYARAQAEAHRHDRLPERARAHRGRRSGAARLLRSAAARRPRHHPGARAIRRSTARATPRWGTCAATRSVELHTKMQAAGFEIVMHGGVQPAGRAGVVAEQAARAPRPQPAADAACSSWLLPLAKWMEALKLGRGLSLIGVGRRPS